MKARTETRLSPRAMKELADFRKFDVMKDDIAQQTIAAVLYAYHLQGFRGKRLTDMFENILAVLNMPAQHTGNMIEGLSLMKFLTKEYGVDFDRVHLQGETEAEYLKRVLK